MSAMTPKIKWTIAIVGLLVGNIAAMVTLATVASATAPAIVPDYYDRAAHYDNAIDEAARSRELGWSVAVRIERGRIDVEARAKDGTPLDGAAVRVSGYARAHASRAIDTTLVATGRGIYQAALASTGVHDLTVVIDRGGARFVASATVESR